MAVDMATNEKEDQREKWQGRRESVYVRISTNIENNGGKPPATKSKWTDRRKSLVTHPIHTRASFDDGGQTNSRKSIEKIRLSNANPRRGRA